MSSRSRRRQRQSPPSSPDVDAEELYHSDASRSPSPPFRVEEEDDELEPYVSDPEWNETLWSHDVDRLPPTWSRSSSNSSHSDDSVVSHYSFSEPFNHSNSNSSPRYNGSPSNTSINHNNNNSTNSSNKSQSTFFFQIAFFLCAMTAMYTSRSTLATTIHQVSIIETNRATMETQMQSAQRGLQRIKRQITALEAMKSSSSNNHLENTAMGIGTAVNKGQTQRIRNENTRALRDMHTLQNRIKEETSLVERLKIQVQNAARRDVIAKYGRGPHRIEMELVFPDKKVGGANRFVIELADVEIMPHSTLTFLEMVSLGLLDGCSFILNALHVVKAAPLPYDGSSAAAKAQAFTQAGLESVAFKEYSPHYPHKQYTVGFAADGSPSFYINTEDNSEVHVGDPCFGRIVSGLETVRRLEASPTRNGIWFERRIGIKVARILKD